MSIGDFTDQAAAYHRSRPSYPAALLDQLTAELGLEPGDEVADVGAGTGILTQQLADRGLEVTAIEPNPAMRSYADPREGVIWVDGTFEDTHLPANTRKWVVAAQAFHWADPPKALPELARVLVPGGALTVMWNDRDHEANAHMRFAREAIRREVPGFDEAYRDRDWAEVLTTGGHFGEVSYREVAHVVPMPRARFLELWRGHNRLNNIAGPDRFAKLIAAIESHLDEGNVDEVPVAYRCRAWTAKRVE